MTKAEKEPDWQDGSEDFDAICENDCEEDVGDVASRQGNSLIREIVTQMICTGRIADLLPIWIFERRSLLEVYADFFAHPDEFVAVANIPCPEDRFLAVVRFYFLSLNGLRRHENARKPYNPILGETFRCRWTCTNVKTTGTTTRGGPFPGSDISQLTFTAEQVSHHPPVSAFYAEHPVQRISYTGHLHTKVAVMQVLPPSIGAYNIGKGVLTLHKLDEEYIMTFPDAYGRNILQRPYVEFGGKVYLTCVKNKYKAKIEFKTKSDGAHHHISAKLYHNDEKFMKLTGAWTGTVTAERFGKAAGKFVFFDAKAKKAKRKEVDPIAKQGDFESRRLWRHVTVALFRNDLDRAKRAKEWLSQRQRVEAEARRSQGQKWIPKNFEPKEERKEELWKYKNELGRRSVD